MTLWMPYANSTTCVQVLNNEHLHEVIDSSLEIMRAILKGSKTPNARRWRGRIGGLLAYAIIADIEVRARGYEGEPRVRKAFTTISRQGHALAPVMPLWYGDPKLHLSHRSNLIRVDPEYYARRMPPDTPLDMPFHYPREGLS